MADAFRTTMAETGAGIVTASVSTAVAFFALLLARVGGIRDLGLICGVGMILTLASTLVLLPALVALTARVRPTRERQRGMSGFGLEPLSRVVVKNNRSVGVVFSLVTLALALVLLGHGVRGRPFLDDDFRQFRPENSAAVRLDEELEERMGVKLRSLKVVLRDESASHLLDRTDRIARALRQRDDLALVQSATDFVPPPSRQRRVLEEIERVRAARPDALDPERVGQALIRSLEESSGRPAGQAFLASVERGRRALGVTETLPAETLLDSALAPLLRRFLSRGHGASGREFSSALYLNPTAEVDPDETLGEIVSLLGEVDPGAKVVGFKAIGRVIKDQVRRDLVLSTAAALFGVIVCLWITFRRPLLVVLTTLPVICGLVWTLGLLLLWTGGEPFSLIGVSVIPLIIGIGIDDGIHIVHRYHMHRGEGLEGIFHHTGRAIAITSLTTIAAFGTLVLADYGGLRASGQMASMGIAACLVTSVVFLPALLTAVFRRDRR
jgi:predicted RND superfamily exporter protein